MHHREELFQGAEKENQGKIQVEKGKAQNPKPYDENVIVEECNLYRK